MAVHLRLQRMTPLHEGSLGVVEHAGSPKCLQGEQKQRPKLDGPTDSYHTKAMQREFGQRVRVRYILIMSLFEILINWSKSIWISLYEFTLLEGNMGRYKKVILKHCNTFKFGKYSTLALAQSACNADSTCRWVYDGSCDNINSFYLCPESKGLETSSSSCVYDKIGKRNVLVCSIFVTFIVFDIFFKSCN